MMFVSKPHFPSTTSARLASASTLCLVSVALLASAGAPVEYPLSLTVDASLKTATAAVVSSLTIRVDRLMEENRRKRVTDALASSGYANFLNALRALPPIGAIELRDRMVSIRYAREEPEATGRRLVLIADRPLFFASGDPAKNRAGYELTMVELHFNERGEVTGKMTGAARVKPSPNGVVVDDFAEAPVTLTARAPQP